MVLEAKSSAACFSTDIDEEMPTLVRRLQQNVCVEERGFQSVIARKWSPSSQPWRQGVKHDQADRKSVTGRCTRPSLRHSLRWVSKEGRSFVYRAEGISTAEVAQALCLVEVTWDSQGHKRG